MGISHTGIADVETTIQSPSSVVVIACPLEARLAGVCQVADRRVGIGYDLHRLVKGRLLRLGGVEIPYDKGLCGHSDADVLLHAVADALLGASGLGDIGELFPDTDPRFKDADSAELLKIVVRKVAQAGFVPDNVDCVVHAEKPKLSAYKRAMAEGIAAALGIAPERVNVKAKTHEGVGPVGAGEAMAATVVVALRSVEL